MASSKAALGETNRAYWDSQVEKIAGEAWIRNLTQQIVDHLQSHYEWMGLKENPQQSVRMLDYACGTGIASRAMVPFVTEVVGLDVSGGMVEKYNREAKEAGLSESQLYAVRGDLVADEEPLRAPKFFDFDFAIMSMALHHVQDPKAMLATLVERVKPGGRVIIIDWLPMAKAASNEGQGGHISSHHSHTNKGSDSEHKPHPGAHTVTFDGFDEHQMRSWFHDVGCSSSDFVLAANRSEVPPDPTGFKQMFFAKGTKSAT